MLIVSLFEHQSIEEEKKQQKAGLVLYTYVYGEEFSVYFGFCFNNKLFFMSQRTCLIKLCEIKKRKLKKEKTARERQSKVSKRKSSMGRYKNKRQSVCMTETNVTT